MILEPLDFAAYRNASPGIQALMTLAPQYALDFASSGLYSVSGDGRAAEHLVAGVTSRDYVVDMALGIAGAAAASASGPVRAADFGLNRDTMGARAETPNGIFIGHLLRILNTLHKRVR
ncbi:MAG: hypothetical protein JWQ61_894 [Collimonas fungivorans]|jgi:hypothetical protein|nr:hypothetical protein [Collimonas fungivorans]